MADSESAERLRFVVVRRGETGTRNILLQIDIEMNSESSKRIRDFHIKIEDFRVQSQAVTQVTSETSRKLLSHLSFAGSFDFGSCPESWRRT